MNIHKVQNIFISDGTALPVNDASISTLVTGKVAVYGVDMKALNPAGGDTISTQPSIYLAEGKTDSSGTFYPKRSVKISGLNIVQYTAKSYKPQTRKVQVIGYNRKTATGAIEVIGNTEYRFSINFKNEKWIYSNRPLQLNVSFTTATNATQLAVATSTAGAINSSSYKDAVVAVVVGDGTGVYGLTNAANYGVEVTGKDVNQYSSTTFTPNQVYFSVQTNDFSGFGTTTPNTTIQEVGFGNGTYTEVFNIENKDAMYEGITNRRLWPIPALDYSSSATYLLSSAIAETVAGTINEDKVTFSADVSAKVRVGEKVELGGVNYEIKYFISTTVAVLTSPIVATLVAAAVKVRFKYDIINIEFNDQTSIPTGVVVQSNKSVMIAVPSIDAGGTYNSTGTAATNLVALLNGWMATTPLAPANIAL